MYKLAFLIPYYNHPLKIAKLVKALNSFNQEIIIVDDGSNKASKQALDGLKVKVLTRAKNGGKGASLKDGFCFAKELGFSHVFQVDADFQHDISFCEEFISKSMQNPNAIIAANPIYDEFAPKSRLYGRKITNFWNAINTLSLDIKDGMCGFRIYPVDEICSILPSVKSDRMEFDIEILIRSYRRGIKLFWLDLKVAYEDDGVSHFRMLRDNLLISKMHARLFFSLPSYIFKVLKSAK
ncbi:glycosyltransferase family 2 protein [Campylobacter geochelonis]|uniref:glycosyltransferase family 2 protein n=1 Tax=Campylobacter geochelonis TaxID=1780362 RepID=UPI000770B447|nr:glycosyltransferase family 2 protein [Campylobacter geochelonis]CZE49347.1 glycosyl transferase%2C group 2 family protein [Campylobacter geochelonis]